MTENQENQENQQEGPLGYYEDFIGIYENALSEEYCKGIIKAFEYYHGTQSVWCEDDQFSNSIAGRFDYAMELINISNQINGFVERDVNQSLFKCFEEYIHKYGHLKDGKYYSTTQKVQKTPAGGGYHVWHDENNSIEYCTRSMVWMFYLNDDFKGGETEFLYYHKRIQPKQGTLLIWPAGLTHAHRGGLVLEGIKYVVTGWFNVAVEG